MKLKPMVVDGKVSLISGWEPFVGGVRFTIVFEDAAPVHIVLFKYDKVWMNDEKQIITFAETMAFELTDREAYEKLCEVAKRVTKVKI